MNGSGSFVDWYLLRVNYMDHSKSLWLSWEQFNEVMALNL